MLVKLGPRNTCYHLFERSGSWCWRQWKTVKTVKYMIYRFLWRSRFNQNHQKYIEILAFSRQVEQVCTLLSGFFFFPFFHIQVYNFVLYFSTGQWFLRFPCVISNRWKYALYQVLSHLFSLLCYIICLFSYCAMVHSFYSNPNTYLKNKIA